MNDKRNSSLVRGTGEDDESYYGRLDEHISKLEWQSEGHRMWYTHKNPYGCWICEILQIISILRDDIRLVDPETEQELNVDDES